ncbi:MAG: BatA domain-containing protein [Acidobacteria bacterium]|nr:BatA domain-containing protein [Acidobacteriota bacterium]
MSFLSLSPAMAGLLLAATAASIVVLYWLKPPPKRVVVPSNLLWKRLLREKKKKTFLDRLRWWISLMIAITVGLSVATALGRPEVGSSANEIRDITVVIDNSATMATRSSDGYTRWEHAVAEARELLQQGSAGGRFLIVDTTGQAPPTEASDRGSALDVLEGLNVSLGGESKFPMLAASDGELYFVSDGVMVDDVPPEATVVSVFEAADNVGITAFEIRSVPASPLEYQAFLEVTNASGRPKDARIRLSGSGGGRLGEDVTLQPGESQGRTINLSSFDRGPVRVAVTSDADAFAADDYAFSFLPVRNRMVVVLVSPGSIYLENLLLIEPRITVDFKTPQEYVTGVAADVYIFDRYAPPTPPSGPALLFLPPDVSWLAPTLGIVESPEVMGWNAAHPLLQFVSLEDLRVDRAARISPLASTDGSADLADIIVGSPSSPLIVVTENPEKVLRVSFALEDSNFPLQPGFPIFISNALSWMMDEQVALTSAPGRVEVPLPAATVVDLEGKEVVTWTLTERTVFVADGPGLYTAASGTRRLRVAVNLADRERSAVNATSFGPDVQTASISQPSGAVQPAGWGDELWILLLTIATALVIVEWFTYHRRLTV